MAEDPFAPVQVKPEGPFITFSIKSGGGYADTMMQLRGTIPELAEILKVNLDEVQNSVWSLALRANDLARALQADEANKQGKA